MKEDKNNDLAQVNIKQIFTKQIGKWTFTCKPTKSKPRQHLL